AFAYNKINEKRVFLQVEDKQVPAVVEIDNAENGTTAFLSAVAKLEWKDLLPKAQKQAYEKHLDNERSWVVSARKSFNRIK
ncbi:MAG: hypothetical protein LBU09_04775, partial [Endomicrobium sp.]|nr:hypothetical protein [Endomicrobium sp.]